MRLALTIATALLVVGCSVDPEPTPLQEYTLTVDYRDIGMTCSSAIGMDVFNSSTQKWTYYFVRSNPDRFVSDDLIVALPVGKHAYRVYKCFSGDPACMGDSIGFELTAESRNHTAVIECRD